VAIQGASQNAAQAAQQNASVQQAAKSIDPAKEADIRALMELVGARDIVQESMTTTSEQYREKLVATVPSNDKGQAFVNTFIATYQKKYDVEQVTEQLVGIYDKHYSDDEIRGLLQFYGSPLGQKVAAEMPKINHETQEAARAASGKAAKDSLQAVKDQNPDVGQSARLGSGQRRWQQRSTENSQTTSASTPANASGSTPATAQANSPQP
jgi:hypothetical protein